MQVLRITFGHYFNCTKPSVGFLLDDDIMPTKAVLWRAKELTDSLLAPHKTVLMRYQFVTGWTCRLLSRPRTPDNSLPLRLWPACASTAASPTNRGKEFHSIYTRYILKTDRSSAYYGYTSTLSRRLV